MKKNKGPGKDWSEELQMLNPNCAGIDVGSGEHFVCVPSNRDANNVQKFPCFTADLYRCATWLKTTL